MTIKNTNWLIVVVHFILVRETSCSFSALETTTPPINFTKRIELAASTQATPVRPENGSSSVAVETRHEVKSTCKYCWTNEPKRTVISNLLRLRMRSLAENNTLFHDYCRTSLYRRNEAAAQYYQLVYLRFCDVSSYNGICNDPKSEYHPVDIDSIVRWWLRYNNVSFTTQGNDKFEDTTSGSQPTISDVYCKQISSYFTTLITGYEPMWSNMSLLNDSNRNKTVDFGFPFANPLYKEVHVRSPDFCKSIYCGFALSNGKVTPHARIGCYPTSCRTGEIASIVMYAVLSPIVVVANLLVLVVAVKTDLLKNVPGYFKIQLAVADLLIGAVVLPGVVYQHYSEYFKPLPWSYKGDSTSNIVTSSEYSKQYLNAMGIISVLSLVVSVSTLCAASIDRYLAISKPFRYIQGSNFMTKVTSLILCSVWIAGLLCSLLPLFNHSQYTFFDNGLFFAQDGLSLVIVGALMGLVLLGTWVINGMTIFCVGKHFSTRRRTLKIQRTGRTSTSHCDGDGNRISVLSRNKTMSKTTNTNQNLKSGNARAENMEDQEKAIFRTLAIMVGAFTLAVLPTFIVVLTVLPTANLNEVPTAPTETAVAGKVTLFVLYSNSFWNFIIYSVRDRRFRQAIINIFNIEKESKIILPTTTPQNTQDTSKNLYGQTSEL